MGCAVHVTGSRQKMAEPQVSVLMPVYNAGPYLRLAVLSIVRQSFGDWELLVIDDASTDGAVGSIADIADARIRVVANARNLGLAATLNVGIDLARGEFIARMDQDDIAYPARLERQLEALKRHTELDLVGVCCLAIDERDELVGALPFALSHEALCARPWRGFYLPHPTWMGRTEWFRRHRYANPAPYLCEDQELLLRTYRHSRFATVPEILFAYRVRAATAWRKALATRRAVIGMQVAHFAGLRQWRHCALAALVFAARVAADAANAMLGRIGFAGLRRHRAVPVDAAELVRWAQVRSALRGNGPA